MVNIEKIDRVDFHGNVEPSVGTNFESDLLIFDNPMVHNVDKFSSAGGWTNELNLDLKKINIASYSWTFMSSADDAINKSSKHLMDLIRYYEGDAQNNYRAKISYTDRNRVKTYGYGIVNKSGKVRNILLKNGVTLPPKNETMAYKAVIVFLREVSEPEIRDNLNKAKVNYDKLPNSIKEALLDLHFNKGIDTISKNSTLKNALKNENWAIALKEMIVARAAANPKIDNPGLYRRSLSRIILAARDIPKTPDVDKVIKDLYTKAIAYVEQFNKTQTNPSKKISKSAYTETMNKIFNTYKNEGAAAAQASQTVTQQKQIFKPTAETSLYSLAASVFPDGTKEVKVAFIQEVLKLNPSLKSGNDGLDADGWPKCRTIASNEKITIPEKIIVNNQTIRVNAGNLALAALSEQQANVVPSGGSDDVQISEDISNIEFMMSEFGENNISDQRIGVANYNLICRDFIYTVGNGDTLWRIANSYNVDLTTLKQYNGITSNTISIGQKIKIPKIVYQTKSGDTLTSISKRLGLTIDVLKDLNSIDDINKIQVGQTIEVPGYPYIVKNGDNLKKIADNAGVSVETLKALNGLRSNKIQPKQKLVIVFNNADYNDVKTTEKVSNKKYYKAPVSGRSATVYPYYRHHYDNGRTVATKEVFSPTSSRGNLKGKRIIINAGHGFTSAGHDPGARNRAAKYDESEITYLNAMALADKLRAQGATVVFIQGGVNLAAEAIKKETSADMMISLHVNSSKAREVSNNRVEIYYNSRFCPKGKTLADNIDKNLDAKHPRNKHYADVHTANHCVTRASGNKIPSVLVELGFINNSTFRASTNSNPVCTEIINAISKSVTNYKF